jgi:hypothetical protein
VFSFWLFFSHWQLSISHTASANFCLFQSFCVFLGLFYILKQFGIVKLPVVNSVLLDDVLFLACLYIYISQKSVSIWTTF